MSYTKTTWETGDVITAQKLNNMETGIESGNSNILYVTISGSIGNYQSDKTFAEIKTAYDAGKVIIVKDHVNYFGTSIGVIEPEEDTYIFIASGSTCDTVPSPTIYTYTVFIDSDNSVSYAAVSYVNTDANQ